MYAAIKTKTLEKSKIYLDGFSIEAQKIYELKRIYLPQIVFNCEKIEIMSGLVRDEDGFLGWMIRCPMRLHTDDLPMTLEMMVLEDSEYLDYAIIPYNNDQIRSLIIHDGLGHRVVSNDLSKLFRMNII